MRCSASARPAGMCNTFPHMSAHHVDSLACHRSSQWSYTKGGEGSNDRASNSPPGTRSRSCARLARVLVASAAPACCVDDVVPSYGSSCWSLTSGVTGRRGSSHIYTDRSKVFNILPREKIETKCQRHMHGAVLPFFFVALLSRSEGT